MIALDPEVVARWGLTVGAVLGDRVDGTWAVRRGERELVLKGVSPAGRPGWRYPLRVAEALRWQGWPTPEPVEEPVEGPGAVWVLSRRLPGASRAPSVVERRDRGRLLAEVHRSALRTGIDDQRPGFGDPVSRVADPGLERLLRGYERRHPADGRVLRAGRDAAVEWFDAHPGALGQVPCSVIHGDFTSWNLLFDGGGLSGVLDFEAAHRAVQVADFALSWRGDQDEVLLGYDEVRPLSDEEWSLVLPVSWSWMFLGVRDLLSPNGIDLSWQAAHLRRHSPLLAARTGRGGLGILS